MSNEEIVGRLSQHIDNPSEAVYSVTMHNILDLIVRRMGPGALTLTPEDIQLAVEEVREAIDHHLDIREYIEIGLDNWEVIRNL